MTGTLVGERRYAEVVQVEVEAEPQVRRQRLPFVVIVSGAVVALSAAVIALLVPGGGSSTTVTAGGPPPATPATPAATAAAATFPEVGTSDVSYEPGHSSGWHVHPGVHSVVVLSGTLTVYDSDCVRTDYTAGQAYLGGGTAHLAANETDERLDGVVTWVYDKSSTADPGSIVLPPVGCRAS